MQMEAEQGEFVANALKYANTSSGNKIKKIR